MVKITGLYRWSDGANFDAAYYNSEHMRITKELLTPLGLTRLESDTALTGKEPKPGQVVAASNAYFPSLEQAQAALVKAGAALMGDVQNYSTIRPEIHLSTVTCSFSSEV